MPQYAVAVLVSGAAIAAMFLLDFGGSPVKDEPKPPATPVRILKPHRVFRGQSPVRCVAFSPDGETVASGGTDGIVRLWSLDGPNEDAIGPHAAGVTALTFSPDGQYLATGGEQHVELWNVSTGERIEVPSASSLGSRVTALAFSDDGQILAAGCMSGAVHLVHRPLDDKPVASAIPGLGGAVLSVGFVPKLHRLLVGYTYHPEQPNLVCVWELARKDKMLEVAESYKGLITNQPLLSLLISHDDATVLKVGTNRVIVLKKEANNRTFRIQGWIPPDEGRITCAAMSADGQRALLAEEDGLVSLWDLETQKELAELDGCTGLVNCVAFSGDGKSAVAGCQDGAVVVWQLRE